MEPQCGGARLRVRFSSMRARLRFRLSLHLVDEAPETPLRWRIDEWSGGGGGGGVGGVGSLESLGVGAGGEAAAMAAHGRGGEGRRFAVEAACEQYSVGFGRLVNIANAVHALMLR
eukprot:1132406-Pleurochrysis_carterae.AAC.3